MYLIYCTLDCLGEISILFCLQSLNGFKCFLKINFFRDAASRRSKIELRPYLVFNVRNSQEIGDENTG